MCDVQAINSFGESASVIVVAGRVLLSSKINYVIM